MFFYHVTVCFLTFAYVSEGRIVQGIIGQNVSFAWTLNNIWNDIIQIHHNKLIFLTVWPVNNFSYISEQSDRVRVAVDTTEDKTVTLNIIFLNVTKGDDGMYRVIRKRNSEELNDIVLLETTEKPMIPKIAIVAQNILDSTVVLQCRLSSPSTMEVVWMVNGSLIVNHGRYSQNDSFLSIKNFAVKDQYSLYKCKKSGSGSESAPYKIKISGPNVMMISPNITTVKEHEGLNLSCLADCNPICTWRWSYLDLLLGQERVLSAMNILDINNVTRRNAGKYSCKVQNIITGVSLEKVRNVDVVYGPDKIIFNTTNNTIHLKELDSITIFCSADCFPPCLMYWNKSENVFPGAELKLHNVTKDVNYTCHATNPKHHNANMSDIVNIVLSSGTAYNTTTTMTTEEENKKVFDPPSKLLIVYIILGLGGILVGVCCTCLLQKSKHCSLFERPSHTIPLMNPNGDRENENIEAVHISQGYWTIVSDAQGELSTALERDFSKGQEQTYPSNINIQKMNEQEQIVQFQNISADTGEDEYIHPIHSVPSHTDF